MASNKDLLDAQRYNRARLVNAFTSGTPGGREVATRSPASPLIAGAVLALVLILVAVVMGRLEPPLPSDWQDNKLVVLQDSGTRYFTIGGALRPVANVTSARLLADPTKYKVATVNAAALAGIPRGSAIGIAGAPERPPDASALRSDQWSACDTDSGKNHVWVGGDPSGLAPATTALVASGGKTYLISGGRRFAVTAGTLSPLGLDTAKVHPVTASWLGLFEEGSDLHPVEISGAGRPASGVPAELSQARIGSLLQVDDGSGKRSYLVSGAGRLTLLTPVAKAMWELGTGATVGSPITATFAQISALTVADSADIPGDWPSTVASPIDAGHQVCARLTDSAQAGSAELAEIPATGSEDAGGVSVAGGSGALVRATAGGSLGAVSLITEPGLAFGLDGPLAETLARLGYADTDVHNVPAAWVSLVPPGVALSQAAAQATVKTP